MKRVSDRPDIFAAHDINTKHHVNIQLHKILIIYVKNFKTGVPNLFPTSTSLKRMIFFIDLPIFISIIYCIQHNHNTNNCIQKNLKITILLRI